MKIRKATFKDLKQLAVLFNAYRVFYRKDADVKAAEKFLKERLNNGDSEIFVCVNDENKLLAFVQLYPLFSSTKMKKLWLLNDLYVHQQFRGQGLSTMLINRAKELVITTLACGLFLETEKSNIIGNKLYPKTGFKLNENANYYEWHNEK